MQPQVGIHRQHSGLFRFRGQVVIKEERFANPPWRKQRQRSSRLSPKQREITLRKLGAPDFNFVECFHPIIVVNCRINRNCDFFNNQQQRPG